MAPPRTTYRVQVRPDFGFADTAALADYLATLGVSHLYAAPILQAAPGSVHGYDVVEHGHANDELGGESGRVDLVAALRRYDLGLVVDIVPNHMGVAVPVANPAWWDLLRRGADSSYAGWFDIDWSRGRLVLPVLGDEPDALDRLTVADGELRYFEHRFPIADGTAGGSPAEVHDRQHYELVCWRRGGAINYRRFFAVSELAAVRVEEPAVFEATHAEVLRWCAEGDVDGIRIDHPDGLVDPAGYLHRLRAAAPDTWLVVEKILEPGERLPAWPVAGTSGYDALAEVTGLFVADTGETALAAADGVDYDDLVHACKVDVATGMLRAELDRLVRLVPDHDPAVVGVTLAELMACFDVYRSYLPDGLTDLAFAATRATRRRPDLANVVDELLPRLSDPGDELAVRFQQTSSAVMAKGVEDTAFYRYTGFVAANEVGCGPGVAAPPETFHDACWRRLADHPDGMTTLSTHDTKRSEDVRARLAVLAELPDEWTRTMNSWMAAAPLPDPAVSRFLWQTVVGAWPISPDRLHAVMEKSAREARTATSWDDPDEVFEAAMHAVVDRALTDPELAGEVRDFAARITPYGWVNSLGQKLVQLTMPGIPDVYQGCELWDHSLVDPDNRRPVDFAARRDLLARLDEGWLPPVDATGAVKLLVTSRALRLRRDHPELFTAYQPLPVTGTAAEHAVAYDRGGALTVATRLPVRLDQRGGWAETTLSLPPGDWTDALTAQGWSGRVRLADLLTTFPVALLTRA
ncbi:MAG: malto-oligosyltrehalose synthase [Actinocatenispora sp.]